MKVQYRSSDCPHTVGRALTCDQTGRGEARHGAALLVGGRDGHRVRLTAAEAGETAPVAQRHAGLRLPVRR